jgi:hypothetical protein
MSGGAAMSGLWTNDRDGLAEALSDHIEGDVMCSIVADELIAVGAVQVLDPGNTELVERFARFIAAREGYAWND